MLWSSLRNPKTFVEVRPDGEVSMPYQQDVSVTILYFSFADGYMDMIDDEQHRRRGDKLLSD